MFSNALQKDLETLEGDTYGEFEKKFINVLNTHAPIKTKMIRFNNNLFMTKELRREIKKRPELRNKFNRNRNQCLNCTLLKILPHLVSQLYFEFSR